MVKPPLLLLKMISFLVGPPCLLEPAQILFNLPIFYPVVVVEEVVVIVEEVVEEEVVVVVEVEVEVVPPFPARPRLRSWRQRPSAVSAAW
jgi:hypothetical protein